MVLGIGSTRILRTKRFAATFHQLPSEDSKALIGKLEDILVRRSVNYAGLVTAPSHRAVEEIAEHRFAGRDAIRFEANVSDARSDDLLPPRDGRLDAVRLLFAGRLTEQKGLDRIRVLLQASSVPIHLRIAGDGELRASAESLASSTPQPHRVEYIGHTDTLPAELDWADALFMPSRWELNPMTIWESWARGRPVFASDLEVFRDLATQGPLLIFADPSEFGARIAEFSRSLPARQEAHRAALVSFQRHTDERRYLAKYLAG
ncbi:glycosyltransferase family 4 protein [Microbacterium sp. A84]|uniref:glycosyltransferase family 4 protein n=1 Tax=Microbacterium sp. A84 TaxID=3450715 RepID=UPI003F43A6EF